MKYVGVVVCGTRRAEQWRRAFEQAGIDAVVEETDADEASQGACKVLVPKPKLVAANALVTDVTQGRTRLPGSSSTARIIVVAIAIVALIATARFAF